MCGGTNAPERNACPGRGLSPRVRGNLTGGIHRLAAFGSIPACAGEPGWVAPAGFWPEVYPRVCGGTLQAAAGTEKRKGLSPRVRGNRYWWRLVWHCGRSIPACAGEPIAATRAREISRVYPRVCGGTADLPAPEGLSYGLSPRVRGNRLSAGRVMPPTRSIPACAGEPTGTATSPTCAAVYPRVCGGTAGWGECSPRMSGLSPRVRGNRQQQQYRGPGSGSIPACAGEPFW